MDVTVTQKFTKISLDNLETTAQTTAPPPRPPKPPQLIAGHNYFNLMPAPAARNKTTSTVDGEKTIGNSDTKVAITVIIKIDGGYIVSIFFFR